MEVQLYHTPTHTIEEMKKVQKKVFFSKKNTLNLKLLFQFKFPFFCATIDYNLQQKER